MSAAYPLPLCDDHMLRVDPCADSKGGVRRTFPTVVRTRREHECWLGEHQVPAGTRCAKWSLMLEGRPPEWRRIYICEECCTDDLIPERRHRLLARLDEAHARVAARRAQR